MNTKETVMKTLFMLIGISLISSVYATDNINTKNVNPGMDVNPSTNPNPGTCTNPSTSTNPGISTNPDANTNPDPTATPRTNNNDGLGNAGNTTGIGTDHGGGNGPAN